MELALNVAWFIIACASYILLAQRLARRGFEDARGPGRVQCVVALTCALAILFPVISLTDDLYEMQATLEEPSPYCLVIKRAAIKDPSTAGQALNHIVFIVSRFVLGVDWAIQGTIASQATSPQLSSRNLLPRGRAPPSFVVLQVS
jgi:hypothetical protein